MPSINISVNVDLVTCDKCATSRDMVPDAMYLSLDGSYNVTRQRLPNGWVRMNQANTSGAELAYKVYCNSCLSGL